jgi:hypothetical protein
MDNTGGYIFLGLAGLVVYLYMCYCLRGIVRRKGLKHVWFVWIVPLNLYYLCRATGMGVTWAVVWTPLLVLPYVTSLFPIYAAKTISVLIGTIFAVIILFKLTRPCGRRRWFGFLLIIPIVNYFAMWSLAYGPRKYPEEKALEEAGNAGAGLPIENLGVPSGAL